MPKTETVHTRVKPEIKEKADSIFSSIGLTTSQAISLFLTAVITRNGIPFELVGPEEEDEDLKFATSIVTVDGPEPSEYAKKIFLLYKKGDIDIETAKFALKRKYASANHLLERLETIK